MKVSSINFCRKSCFSYLKIVHLLPLSTFQRHQVMKKRILTTVISVCWAIVAISQTDVGIGTASPAARLDVRGNGIVYDVFNASNDLSGPFDSILSFSSKGHLGIGTTNTGNYKLLSYGTPSAFSPQIEVWQGHPNLGGNLLGDINDVGGSNGSFNLYLAGVTKNIQLRAQGVSYFRGGRVGIGISTPAALLDVSGQGTGSAGDIFWAGNDMDFTLDSSMVLTKDGNLGLGTRSPNERLHLNGALVVGPTTAATPVAGTIAFSGGPPSAGFMGYDGFNWLPLDIQWDGDWIIIPGVLGPTLYNIFPGPVAVSAAGYIPPILPIQYAFLYVNNNMPPGAGAFSHQLLLDDVTGGLNSSQGFLITNWQASGLNMQYSQGIFNLDGAFKVTKSGTLLPTNQGDGVTMVRYNQTGITDLPNQSRVRAYQTDPSGIGQLIPQNVWTPVNFNNDSPFASGYDQQNEFTVAANAYVTPAPPENAFFMATSAGYYQVNARCEFDVTTYTVPQGGSGNVVVGTGDWISIAIYKGPQAGATNSYAWGNILQIGYNSPIPEENKLWNNNAPNVSDVVYLQAGEIISIWVYQTASSPMNLKPGPDKLYVSIHKVS
jgi:hypothetical protein